MRRLVLGGLVVMAVFVAAGWPVAVRSAAGPVTLARWPGVVEAVGQDAESVAWCKGAGYDAEVHVLRLGTRVERRVPGSCNAANRIAVAYPSIAWTSWEGAGASNSQTVLYTLVGGRVRKVAESTPSSLGYGDAVRAPVSDGSALFYSVLRIVGNEMDCNLGEAPCYWRIGGGHVYRIVRGRGIAVPAIPPAAVIAVSSGRIATVSPSNRKFGKRGAATVTDAAPNGVVTVRDSRDGTVVTRFQPTGVVREMALTPRYAAVLAEYGTALQIEWYDATSGARIRNLPVALTARQLSASGNFAVFAEGTMTRLLDLQGGSVRNLRRAGGVGLSIDGNRVAWGENDDKTAKVLALTLQ